MEVTIEGGYIAKVEILEHQHDRGEAAEIIVDTIVQAQSLDLDTITGATNSSRVLLKAVENALIENAVK